MFTIYLITNLINNKVYVGQTVQPVSRRWSRHRLDASKGKDIRFYRAIRKYGPQTFNVQELAVIETAEQANNFEKCWIVLLRATNPSFGYNGTFGGEGGRMAEEGKIKRSESCKAWWTPERREQVGKSRKGKFMGSANPMYGKTPWQGKQHSEETKEKISSIRKELFTDPEFKQRMVEANTGKHHTETGRANIAKALKGNQYRKGIPHSSEVKERIAEALRRTMAAKKAVLQESQSLSI